MNINALTDDELLRIVSAETELERILFDRLAVAINEVESAREEVKACGWDSGCSSCDDKDDDINDLSERVTYLEELLDENDIEYNK